MSQSRNEVTIANARLVKDPEVKTFGEREVLAFSVAENFKGKGGTKETRYWDVTMPGTKSKDMIGKGSLVTVRGTLGITEKDGKRYLKIMGNSYGDLTIHTYKDSPKGSPEPSADDAEFP